MTREAVSAAKPAVRAQAKTEKVHGAASAAVLKGLVYGAAVLTFVTAVFMPSEASWFGVLHLNAAAVLLTADAPSELYAHLFARRFACAEGFAALGAGCRTAGRTLYMDGRAALHGAAVTAPDLRGGAALLLAALGAEGVTLLRDPGHIPRGYADLPGDLRTLGADCITEKT